MTPTLYSSLKTDEADEPGGSTCAGCAERFDEGEQAYRELYGSIDRLQDHSFVFSTSGGIVMRNWCQECWNERRGRAKAAHYDVTDGDRLWDILEAADGKIVADLIPMLVGGRGWIRVVGGDVKARHSTMTHTESGIRFGTEPTEEFDVDDFGKYFDDPGERTRVQLRPVEETPFADCARAQEGCAE
jgi:hypothetical protein